ncbi:MAG: 3-hydroxyacyl-ACP dehydratase FabZ family protein [Bacteroidota bacterium]
MTKDQILAALPYDYPFLFVDTLSSISESQVIGAFTFDVDLPFYRGHFKNYPVTPGVILTECCAQIGLACLGIYLMARTQEQKPTSMAMTDANMDFVAPVFPGETVEVVAKKVYFRFQKLRCKVAMKNASGQLVCSGTISGMWGKSP